MAKLGLSVAPDDIKVVQLWHPVGSLLIVGKGINRSSKHSDGQASWWLTEVWVVPLEANILVGREDHLPV